MSVHEPDAHRASNLHWRDLALAVVLALFTYAMAWTAANTTGFGQAPDEWAHASYVDEIASGGHLVPDYEGSRILPTRAQPNYLNHPPLYYAFLGMTARAMEWTVAHNPRELRLLSAGMVALGMFFWVLVARMLGVPPAWSAGMVGACNAIPMFPYLAGSINNDNLAFLGVAISVYGTVLASRRTRAGMLVAAAGLAIALLAKATAGLFLCAFLVAWAAPKWLRREGSLPWRIVALGGVLVAASAGAWFVYALAHYGTVFPKAGELYPPNTPPASPVSAFAFALEFTHQLAKRLPIITSHLPLNPLTGYLRSTFWLMLGAMVVAWCLGSKGVAPYARRIRWSFLGALAVMLLAHLINVRLLYLDTGRFAGMQPRYYAFAVPGVFLFAFLGAWKRAVPSLLFALVAACAAVLVATVPALDASALASKASAGTPVAAPGSTIQYRPASSEATVAYLGVDRRTAGHVDFVKVDNGVATAGGWAIQAKDRSPARSVVVIIGDRVMGTVGTGRDRPDVARVLGAPAAARSGFSLTVRGLPDNVGPCDLQLGVEQQDGSLSMIRPKQCAALPPKAP